MINVLDIQPNEPRAVIYDYVVMVYGIGKAGKTSLFYKLAQTDYIGGLDKALLVAFESGYKALKGIHAQPIGEWKEFQQLVKQLVENKDKVSYKWLGLDTLDYLWQYAEDYVVKRERIARKDAKIKSIGDIAWGAGYKMVSDEVDKQLKALSNAGYGLFLITHDKEKKIELKNGQSFDKTTVTLPERARNLFVNMSDFIIYISIDKEVENGNVTENRFIHFRSDGDIEAGSRFENVPDKIPYDVDTFLETFEKAVLSAYDGDEDAVIKAKEKQELEREEKAKEFVEKETKVQSKEDIEKEIDELIGKMDEAQQKTLKSELKATNGTINYKKYDDLEKLNNALQIAKDILSI